jgi:transposase
VNAPPNPTPDHDQIRAFFRALVRPGDVHELRVPNPRDRRLGVVSGYVDNEDAFVRLASSVGGAGAESVYTTLNPVTPALLARAANRLQRNAKTLTADADVLCYRNLLVDIDPVRPAGIGATDEEREAALGTRAVRHDSKDFEAVLDAVPPVRRPSGQRRKRSAKRHADKGYDFPRCRAVPRRRGIKGRIARRGVERSDRLGCHRWAVERTLAWLKRYRRLTTRWERREDIHQAFVTLACCLVCHRRLQEGYETGF